MKFNCFKVNVTIGDNKTYLFPTLRISRILSGSCIWKIGKEEYSFKDGDIVFLNNIVSRHIIKNNDSPLELEVFEFWPQEMKISPSALSAFYAYPPLIVKDENATTINEILSVISSSFGKTVNDDFFSHLFSAIFALINTENEIKYNNESFAISEYIWEHFAEDLSVSKIASHFNISKSYLESIFKQVYGVCVGEYLRAIRVYQVESKINANQKDSILDIALSCGFSSSSGFYKTYKNITGKTPRR